ncbi:MAG: antirestriction protein [Desulfovibrio sp.]|nr:antirestriction protein [Desulfovibrio sp.]
MSQETTLITEALVPSEKMLEVITRHFGYQATPLEMAVYAYMRHLCPDYDGGVWSYYDLSNGGFYMTPGAREFYELVSPNGYKATMTAKEAGITACIFAFSTLAAKHQSELFCEHYERLQEYVTYCGNKSARKIFAAID